MIIQRHWVGDNFHAVIKASVGFDVNMLCVRISRGQYAVGIGAYFTAVVYFKLNAEIPVTRTVKYRLGFVAVIMNRPAMLVVALSAVVVLA